MDIVEVVIDNTNLSTVFFTVLAIKHAERMTVTCRFVLYTFNFITEAQGRNFGLKSAGINSVG